MKELCTMCPRGCKVARGEGEIGYCRVSNKLKVARAALHMWEEPCISGKNGSGTIFFSGCSLKCVFCQNYEISHDNFGKEITEERLVGIMRELIEKGAHNINFVNPTHYSHILKKILENYDFPVPIVYNCSGYEDVDTLKSLSGLVDIYLTDFKYMEEDLAKRFSKAPKYPEIAKSALTEMVNQQPNLVFDNRGILQSGVIVRNLLLPGHVKNSKEICKYVYEKYGDKVILSIMNQYTPTQNVMNLEKDKELSRKVTKREYERVIDYVLSLGIKNAYIQEGDVASESFIPSWHS